MKETIILGADIGGSHITTAQIDPVRQGLVDGTRFRVAVDASSSAEEIIGAWASVLRRSLTPDIRQIGVAMPGPFDYEEGISLMKDQGKYDRLYGVNIRQRLSAALGTDPAGLVFTNDAESFLRGELFAGAAREASSALALTLGTGLGTARAFNGKAEDAALWCMPLFDGIAEDFLSTRWFVRRYAELTGGTVINVLELVDAGKTAVTERIFREFGRNLASFLNRFMETEEPEIVVLGGNISRSFEWFAPELLKHLLSGVQIVRSSLGEDACLIGAASSCLNRVHTS